jgi:acetate kinase
MNILIFNCGSSSQSCKVYRVAEDGKYEVIASGKARNVATQTQAEPVIEWKINGKLISTKTDLSSQRLAAQKNIAILKDNQVQIDAIGHRFVHGGECFKKTTRIDAEVMVDLKKTFKLAPIHNPNSFSVIEVCLELLPGMPQYVVFDTAFHAQMPEEAKRYALPRKLALEYGFRKYGFHGLSYQYVSAKVAEYLDTPLKDLKMIICHLGSGGSSVVAIKDGHSIDSSMGYSPLQGLVMSTRCGDIDAEIVLELIRDGHSVEDVSKILNNQSGLIGLSGFSSNLAEIIEAGEKGNLDCQIAYDVYVHRLQTYLGAYEWLLNRADVIVFTDDIGIKSWKLRERVCSGVENLGVVIDVEANKNAPIDQITRVSGPKSATQILVAPNDEELVILQEVLAQG